MPALSTLTRPRHAPAGAGISETNAPPPHRPSRLPWKPPSCPSGDAAATAIVRPGSRSLRGTDMDLPGLDVIAETTSSPEGVPSAFTTASTELDELGAKEVVRTTLSDRSPAELLPQFSISSRNSSSSNIFDEGGFEGVGVGQTKSPVPRSVSVDAPERERNVCGGHRLTGYSMLAYENNEDDHGEEVRVSASSVESIGNGGQPGFGVESEATVLHPGGGESNGTKRSSAVEKQELEFLQSERNCGGKRDLERNAKYEDTRPRRVPEGKPDVVSVPSGDRRRSQKPPVFTRQEMPQMPRSLSKGTLKRRSGVKAGKKGGTVMKERGGRGRVDSICDVRGVRREDDRVISASRLIKSTKELKPTSKQQNSREDGASRAWKVSRGDDDAFMRGSANGGAILNAKGARSPPAEDKPVGWQGHRHIHSHRNGFEKEPGATPSRPTPMKSEGSSGGRPHFDKKEDVGIERASTELITGRAGRPCSVDRETYHRAKSPPTSVETTPARRFPSKLGRVSRLRRGENGSCPRPEIFTYVKNKRAAHDDDGPRGTPAPELWGKGPACTARSSFTPFPRRKKRPRPKMEEGRGREEGSARAMVWGESCPACRQQPLVELDAAYPEETATAERTQRFDGPCLGPEGREDSGHGPVKVGEYVFLRNAPAEEIERSLTSEGEFAKPRPGGLFGKDLAGARIRVWREEGGTGGAWGRAGSDSGSNGGAGVGVGYAPARGLFAEADVVKFDPVTSKHRVRFVEDGAVEDLMLIEPGDHTGGREDWRGSGGVRWLQRCARARARDVIRRNVSGLFEGPSGEVEGLLGDEHDPPAQRRENWRWAMSRWRWVVGERDGYATGGREWELTRAGNEGDICENAGVPTAGDGMFPPIGKVLAIERRCLDTGKVWDSATHVGEGRASDIFLKVARLWYPQDTRFGMDPFVHGKAEVFEACRAVVIDAGQNGGKNAVGNAFGCVSGASSTPGLALVATAIAFDDGNRGSSPCNPLRPPRRFSRAKEDTAVAGATCYSHATAVFSRLDAERPVDPAIRLEPVLVWVRACEAWRPASVQRCLDDRVNPCVGKVVNDPFQPQADFFLRRRYCLELDAYFPLESAAVPGARVGTDAGNARSFPSVGTPSVQRVEVGNGGDKGDDEDDESNGGQPSPRSTKVRLLTKQVFNGTFDPPPKWPSPKEQRSLDKVSPAAAVIKAAPVSGRSWTGSGDPTVVGWESATRRRCGRIDAAAVVDPVLSWGSTSLSPEDTSARSAPSDPNPEELFLCHRCRHVLPSRRLRRCLGGGCGKRFCAPCRTRERSVSLGGSKTRSGEAQSAIEAPRNDSSGPGDSRIPDCGGGGEGRGCATPVPWTGLCCRGQCGCVECGAATETGLVASWQARNGFPSLPTAGGGGGRGRLLAATERWRRWRAPRTAKSRLGEAVGWSGWQGVRREVKAESVEVDDVTLWRRDAEQKQELEDIRKNKQDERVVVAKAAVIEWCKSCGGPGPRGSLTRCYHCRRGVHTDGCREFEDSLTSRRLDEHGIGPAGRLVVAPTGAGAVGHGVAVCVGGRWRAGLVLCWSPILGAHYLRYIDVAGVNGVTTLDLEALPWDGEWVVLSASSGRGRKVEAVVNGAGATGGNHPHRSGFVVHASAIRWTLLEITLKLFPPRTGVDDAPTAADVTSSGAGARPSAVVAPKPPPHPPESKLATRVLRGLLKQRFEARHAAAGERKNAVSAKYRPPAVVLPASISDLGGANDVAGCSNGGDKGFLARTPPWVCLRCTEGKLRRLQRRVRCQFQAPREEAEAETPKVFSSVYCDAPATAQNAAGSTTEKLATILPSAKATDRGGISPVAGWMQPANPGRTLFSCPVGEGEKPGERPPRVSNKSGASFQRNAMHKSMTVVNEEASSKGQIVIRGGDHGAGGLNAGAIIPAMTVDTDVDTARTEERRRQELRRVRGDRRLRWLPAGNDPQGVRPFAYEAGFVSDLTDLHAHGGVTASGVRVSAPLRSVRRKKRTGAPAVSRAFAHLLDGLDAQGPLAFALPPEITHLDRDLVTFFSRHGVGGEENCESVGLVEDALRDTRAVVIVDGTVPGGRMANDAEENRLPGKACRGDSVEFPRIASERSFTAQPRVPEGFSVVKEVDLESSARIRPLAGRKKGKLRPSSSGGGVRRVSQAYRMSTTENSLLAGDGLAAASAALAGTVAGTALAASPGRAGGTGAAEGPSTISKITTTLKDVSRKDRMQRMDQRRMRRQGQELVGAGLLNIDVLQSRRKKLRFGRSSVHAWGVFADEPIAAGDLVIEYRGEIIRNAVADKREKLYEEMQIGSDYMFRVDEDTVIDATFKGSLARFINHSCDPSCTTRIIAVEGSKKIVIYAERDIAMGEELFYDYKFPLEVDESARVPCHCGSEKCRGFIN